MTTSIKDPAVEAARAWAKDEMDRREGLASRAKTIHGVVHHQAAANRLRTLLADHATQALALADALAKVRDADELLSEAAALFRRYEREHNRKAENAIEAGGVANAESSAGKATTNGVMAGRIELFRSALAYNGS